ncbi:hypothetical protein JCM11641_007212 [Rhodosporidiobolus odoratus]
MSGDSSNSRAASPATSANSGRSTGARAGPASNSNLESTITRLLVATKQLLEGLAKWSRGEVSEDAISAIYVKLGNDFNVACAAFAREKIGMNELLSVPSDLRICLETCLSDTPSQAALERHLPQVRQIIIGLLHGLREKQRLYREGSAARRERERAANAAAAAGGQAAHVGHGIGASPGQSGIPLTPASAGRSRDELRRFVTAAAAAPPPPTHEENGGYGYNRGRHSDGSVSTTSSASLNGSMARRGGSEASAFPSRSSGGGGGMGPQRGGSLRERGSLHERDSSRSSTRGTLEDIGLMPSVISREAPAMPRSNSTTSMDSNASAPQSVASTGGTRTPRTRSPPPPSRSRGEAVPAVPRTPTTDTFPTGFPAASTANSASSSSNPPQAPNQPQQQHQYRSQVLRLPPPSTIVRPPSSASINDDEPSAPLPPSQSRPQPPSQSQAQAQSASLEALKTSDHLSRRASKRYSAYAIQKMTSPQPGSTTAGGGGGTSPSPGGDGSPRADKPRIRERDFAVNGFGLGSGAGTEGGVRRSQSSREHRPSRSLGGGGGVGAPPVPGIPRSWSSSQNLRGQRSPIAEEEEEEGEEDEEDGGEGDDESPVRRDAGMRTGGGRKRPSVTPPPALSATPGQDGMPRSGSAPTLSSPSLSITLAPPFGSDVGPAHPGYLAPRGSSPALPPLPISRSTSTTPSILPSPSPPTQRDPTGPLSIFLRLGPRVRRAHLPSPPTSIEQLRQLFCERFGYSPGVTEGGWPELYLCDEKTGVRWELEELEEVREGSVVSLEVDAVEQVKHHIDSGLSTLSQEIKELRATVTAMRRLSTSHLNTSSLLSPDAGGLSPTSGSVGMRPSPSQKQFENAAEMVLRMRRAGSTTSLLPFASSEDGDKGKKADEGAEKKDLSPATATAPSAVPPPPPPTSGETFSPTTSTSIGPIVTTLRSQHSEVQNLRREIGILRQVYIDFTSSTKSQFASLRVQTSHLHGLAQSKLSTDRAFVEAGTVKLDGESTDLVVRVDELQDTIEQLRADTVRGVKPRPQQLSETASLLRKAVDQRNKLETWLKEVKPSWSQMWSVELSRILGEQKAVETQETLLGELEEDLEDTQKVLSNIQAVAKQLKPSTSSSSVGSASGTGGGPGVRLRELGGGVDSHEGLNTVLMEVRALQPDPSKRLEAIERAEREREKQLAAGQTDEFKQELGAFVGEGKLKKSGGIEEAERMRQKKSEATLKAMFSG